MKFPVSTFRHKLACCTLGLLCIAMFTLPSCQRKNPLVIDLSGIGASARWHHFDEAIMGIPDTLFFQRFPGIFPGFSALFPTDECDSLITAEMLTMRTDPHYIELYERQKAMMGDLGKETGETEKVLKHYRHYYPDAPAQEIYTRISGLDLQFLTSPVILNDTLAIICTDLFLGEEFEPYILMGIPAYKRKWMVPSMIAPEYARQLAFLHSGTADKAETLLDQMVYQGKVLWFMDAMMPLADDTLKIRYSKGQLDWCRNHQRDVWAYLINNRMLYSSDQNIQKSFILDAPFTAAFTEVSPGRIGHWIGWQIVRKYMEKHPDMTLLELMEEQDAQKILKESGFKPK